MSLEYHSMQVLQVSIDVEPYQRLWKNQAVWCPSEHLCTWVNMYSEVINSGNKLTLARVVLSKSMLLRTKYIMCVKMLGFFQSTGTFRCFREAWYISVSIKAIELAVSLSSHGEIPSGLHALWTSKPCNKWTTPLTVRCRESIVGYILSSNRGKLEVSSSVKTLENSY